MPLKGVDKTDLGGPVIDRRTSMKLLAAAGMGSLAGCYEGDDTDADPDSAGSIKVGLAQDHMEEGDAARIWAQSSWPILIHVYNSLLKINSNGEIVGELAQDWEILDDTTYEFVLHEGVEFHNRDPLDAEAVEWHINRVSELEDSPYAGVANRIESFDVTDERTFQMSLEEPYAPFLVSLMAPEGLGAITNKTAYEDDPEHYRSYPVGSGPFKLTEREPGESVTFEKFENYWETDDDGNAIPYLDEIQYQLIPEPSTMWTAASSGEIHLADEVGYDRADAIENNPDLELDVLSKGAYKSVEMLATDPTSEEGRARAEIVAPDREVTDRWEDRDLVTADPNVRKAISMAIDREEIVETAWFGYAQPAHGFMVPSMGELFYEPEPENGHYHDPDEAERLLDEAGYTGSPRFSVRILGWETAWTDRLATVLQQQLDRVGIDSELDIRSGSEAFDVIYNFEHELFLYAAANLFEPTVQMTELFMEPTEGSLKGGVNYGLWHDPEYDELMESALVEPDPEDQEPYISDAHDRLLEGCPHTWVVHDELIRPRDSALKGVEQIALLQRLHRAYLDS